MKLDRTITVYQIDCKVYIVHSIPYRFVQKEITFLMDRSLAQEEDYLTLHKKNCYKNYVYSGFKEIESDKVYKEGGLYTFSIRCIEEEMADYLVKQLSNTSIQSMKALSCQKKEIRRCQIKKLYLITPAVEKFEDGYWRTSHTFLEFQERLFINLKKKYEQYTGKELEGLTPFYETIRLINEKPIKTLYKEVALLGDKIELDILDTPEAQELAYFSLGTGLCELNSRGFGYVNYKTR